MVATIRNLTSSSATLRSTARLCASRRRWSSSGSASGWPAAPTAARPTLPPRASSSARRSPRSSRCSSARAAGPAPTSPACCGCRAASRVSPRPPDHPGAPSPSSQRSARSSAAFQSPSEPSLTSRSRSISSSASTERATRRCTGGGRAGSGAAGVPSSRQRRTSFRARLSVRRRRFLHPRPLPIGGHQTTPLALFAPRSRHVCAPSSVTPMLYRVPENSTLLYIIPTYISNGTYALDSIISTNYALTRTHPTPRCNCLPKMESILYGSFRTEHIWFSGQIIRVIIDTCNGGPSKGESALICDEFSRLSCYTETL